MHSRWRSQNNTHTRTHVIGRAARTSTLYPLDTCAPLAPPHQLTLSSINPQSPAPKTTPRQKPYLYPPCIHPIVESRFLPLDLISRYHRRALTSASTISCCKYPCVRRPLSFIPVACPFCSPFPSSSTKISPCGLFFLIYPSLLLDDQCFSPTPAPRSIWHGQ